MKSNFLQRKSEIESRKKLMDQIAARPIEMRHSLSKLLILILLEDNKMLKESLVELLMKVHD